MRSVTSEGPESTRLRADRYSETQKATIDVALDLFAIHGVSATSYQMISDALGVTKAAVYHQFKSKDGLVLAVAEVGLSPLEDALDAAENETSPARAREVLLTRVVDLAIVRRRWAVALESDPVMNRLLRSHEPFVDLMNRIYSLLLGLEGDSSARIRTAIVSSAIGSALAHPLVAELDDDTLRAELMAVCHQLFNLPHASS
jgi:AcrR family transcriptional regulator